MRRSRVVALLAAGGFAVAGCSAPGPAEVTFYADGHTINTTPTITCDYTQPDQNACRTVSSPGTLKVRPGKPVQVSVPGEIAKVPWRILAEYITPQGEYKQVEPVLITSLDRYAYTVTPPTPADRVSAIDIQAYSAIVSTASGSDIAPSDFWGLRLEA